MKTRISNTILAVLASNPSFSFITRAAFANKRSIDREACKGSYLDEVGEMLFVKDNSDQAVIIPASELKYLRSSQISDLGLSRLTKLVVSEDGGVLCTATGPVPEEWLRTFSKLTPFKGGDTHFVKCFAPSYEGPITGYHAIRADNRQKMNFKEFTQIDGRKMLGLDFVSHEGKAMLAATLKGNHQNPKTTVFTREADIQSLKDGTSVNSQWKPAPWVGDRNISSLRGFIKDGVLMYSFLDTTTGDFLSAGATDKGAKVVMKDVKGVLTTVSGVQNDPNHMATVITNKQIVAIGQKDTVIADLSDPAYAEIAQLVRGGKNLTGIYGRQSLYASSVGNMGHLTVTPNKPYAQARA
ncbi:hypothetical protein HZA44_02365 [Candidatus Peregrinibacteria bacterium]|nr:hypothetical protein [Candidatus Peregrinibacteria bacterium]